MRGIGRFLVRRETRRSRRVRSGGKAVLGVGFEASRSDYKQLGASPDAHGGEFDLFSY
jgi:hypothetical protein